MWYVIQTVTGEEQELVDMVHKVIPVTCYRDFFVLKRESMRKRKGRYQVELMPLFPSYVFAITDDPEGLFYKLKQVPKLSKLLGNCGDSFVSVSKEEVEFLEDIQDGDEQHIVRRSLVEVDEEGQVVWAEGALEKYKDRIIKQRLRKRYVIIEQELLGEKREVLLGIKMEEDDPTKYGI